MHKLDFEKHSVRYARDFWFMFVSCKSNAPVIVAPVDKFYTDIDFKIMLNMIIHMIYQENTHKHTHTHATFPTIETKLKITLFRM